MIIFKHVRLSSNRIQPASQTTRDSSNHIQLQGITRRDVYLLRHIILMFCIFIGGWGPAYIIGVVVPNFTFNSLIASISILVAELSLFIDIINLFVYNHELRRYLSNKVFRL